MAKPEEAEPPGSHRHYGGINGARAAALTSGLAPGRYSRLAGQRLSLRAHGLTGRSSAGRPRHEAFMGEREHPLGNLPTLRIGRPLLQHVEGGL